MYETVRGEKSHILRDGPEISVVSEETGHPDAKQMIRNLVDDQQAISAVSRRVIEAAGAAGDQASADLATRRQDVHDKNAWMLQSHLE